MKIQLSKDEIIVIEAALCLYRQTVLDKSYFVFDGGALIRHATKKEFKEKIAFANDILKLDMKFKEIIENED